MVFIFFSMNISLPTASPGHTHASHAAHTPWTIQGMICLLLWEKAKDFQTLPENQHSQVAFLLTDLPHLPCRYPLPPLSLADGPSRQRMSDWEPL